MCVCVCLVVCGGVEVTLQQQRLSKNHTATSSATNAAHTSQAAHTRQRKHPPHAYTGMQIPLIFLKF